MFVPFRTARSAQRMEASTAWAMFSVFVLRERDGSGEDLWWGLYLVVCGFTLMLRSDLQTSMDFGLMFVEGLLTHEFESGRKQEAFILAAVRIVFWAIAVKALTSCLDGDP